MVTAMTNNTTADKVAHVKAAKQTRGHLCHWPGCDKQVPPAMWGCKAHWFSLPKRLRDRIWATYRAGQEKTMTPSADYIAAAKAVQEWIAEWNRLNRSRSDTRETFDIPAFLRRWND